MAIGGGTAVVLGDETARQILQVGHEAIAAAEAEGKGRPQRLRCWRSSMRTMVQRAAAELDLEMIASRRTYALLDWLMQREQEVYPQEEGFMAGPLAPPPAPVQSVPLPTYDGQLNWLQ